MPTSLAPQLLDELRRSSAILREDLAALDVTVLRARAHGATWTDVADALGMTRQGARRRYVDPAATAAAL